MITVIEYLIHIGTLTGTVNDVRFKDEGGVVSVMSWNFPQPQMTIEQLITIENSSEYRSYLNNRANILSRKAARAFIDNGGKRFALIVLDEINALRQWDMDFKAAVAASTSLANLQSRVAALPNLPQRTIEQLKNAMDLKY